DAIRDAAYIKAANTSANTWDFVIITEKHSNKSWGAFLLQSGICHSRGQTQPSTAMYLARFTHARARSAKRARV
ncbi:MAG: hypothetical protein IKU34_04905, partial [Clostridia bacterium]|nr:hypothetical protein [Clostridia bacterium]